MSTVGKLTFEALKKVISSRIASQGFESLIFKELQLVSCNEGCCKCELKVTKPMLNIRGTMHGGVSASLVDAVSTYALMTTGKGEPGMSLDLNISYMKPVFLDDVLVVDAKTLNVGKTFAVATVDITKKETGQLVAHGRHSKYVAS